MIHTDDELIFDMVEFRNKQVEIVRQEKWKKIQEKMEIAKTNYYKIWREKNDGRKGPGSFQ